MGRRIGGVDYRCAVVAHGGRVGRQAEICAGLDGGCGCGVSARCMGVGIGRAYGELLGPHRKGVGRAAVHADVGITHPAAQLAVGIGQVDIGGQRLAAVVSRYEGDGLAGDRPGIGAARGCGRHAVVKQLHGHIGRRRVGGGDCTAALQRNHIKQEIRATELGVKRVAGGWRGDQVVVANSSLQALKPADAGGCGERQGAALGRVSRVPALGAI